MESLNELPIDDESKGLSQNDREIMHKYIGNTSKKFKKSDETSEGLWRKIGYAVLTFIILANPLNASLLSKIPYIGGNNITEFLFITVMFIIAIVVIQFYG